MQKSKVTRPIFLFAALCLVFGLAAQQGRIFGNLTDGSDQPLPYATVQLLNHKESTLSSETGFYDFSGLPAGTYRIKVIALGYQFEERSLVLAEDEQRQLDFTSLNDALALNEVVVSATLKSTKKLDSPIPVEVYSERFFKANPAPSIFESLQTINGVRPQLNCNICNTGDIHINGLEGPYTMVLIDGLPIVSGLSTVYGLTGIPQSLIERIEIVKGPASTLYGSEAVGGLINVITKKVDAAPQFSVDAFGTDWGEINTDLGMRFNVGEKASSLLGINHFYYQNPIDNNSDGFTDVTLQHRISAFNKWSFQRNSGRVFSLAGRYVYEDRWGGDMNWTSADRGSDRVYGESIYTSRWEVFGTYQLPVAAPVFFTFSANGHRQNSYYGDLLYAANQRVTFGQLTWNPAVHPEHDLLIGAAYRQTFYDDNTPATAKFDPEGRELTNASLIRLPGLFVQDEWTISNRHKLLAGLRYDYNDNHGSIFSPRLNYKYNSPNRQTTLRLGVGNGFRVANVFTEDHAALTGAREVVFANELRPETSWNGNVNLVQQIYFANNASLNLDVSGFYTYFSNRIIPDYEQDPNQIVYDNLDGSAISQGVSVNLDYVAPGGLKMLLGATVQDVSFTEQGVRRQQLLTERWSGVWNIGYTFQRAGLTIDYTGNLYGPMELPLLGPLDDRASESPVWSIQNIQLTKSFGRQHEVYGGVKNLLDFTPPANSIARPFDPFDRDVTFDAAGQVLPTPNNPNALTFDPTYVFAPNQGIRFFLGYRYTLQ